MNARKGFTLVEILIVVVILGILAAIVIPQFTNASTEAMENSLKSDLHTMRAQLELWKVKHGDVPADTLSVLVPSYMREIPTNPFNDLDTETTGLDGTTGWAYDGDANVPDVFANDGGTDADGNLHSSY